MGLRDRLLQGALEQEAERGADLEAHGDAIDAAQAALERRAEDGVGTFRKDSPARCDVQFDAAEFEAGSEVSGTVSLRESIPGRGLSISLHDVSESVDFRESTELGSAKLESGDAGHQERFAFRIPDDALPNVITAAGANRLALLIQTGRGLRGRHCEAHSVPVAMPSAERLTALREQPFNADQQSRKRRWDVSITAADRVLGPGDPVRAEVVIGKPAPGRSLRVGLVCEHENLYDTGTSGGVENSTVGTSRVEAYAEWRDLDSSVARHAETFTVPHGQAHSTFTPHHVKGVSPKSPPFEVTWSVRVTEGRSLRSDPLRAEILRVLPAPAA